MPNYYKITKCPYDIPNGSKLLLMTRPYQNIFHSKVLQNIPKLVFFGLKRNHLATLGSKSIDFIDAYSIEG
jgi:hypothetical protein